jgi:hypothetical protein
MNFPRDAPLSPFIVAAFNNASDSLRLYGVGEIIALKNTEAPPRAVRDNYRDKTTNKSVAGN